VVSHFKVEPVLWFEDLNIQLAFWTVVSHCPGTHDGVLILRERGKGDTERERAEINSNIHNHG
jgi:hypothetical protein